MGKQEKSETFLQHLEPLQGALESYCRRWLRDRGEVEDVLQSAVASAFRDFQRYAEGTSFRAWMFRYAHHEIQNWNRKHARDSHEKLPAELSTEEAWSMAVDEPLFEQLLEDPDAVLDQCESGLADAVRELPAQERAVLLLHAIGEFKYREIADILAIPLGTVMSSLARARLRIRQRLLQAGEKSGLLHREESDRRGEP